MREYKPYTNSKRGTRYLAHPQTFANLPERARTSPGAIAIFLAYAQRGPCRWRDALALAKIYRPDVPVPTLRWWDAELKKRGTVISEDSREGFQLQREEKRARLGFWSRLLEMGREKRISYQAWKAAEALVAGRLAEVTRSGEPLGNIGQFTVDEYIRVRKELLGKREGD